MFFIILIIIVNQRVVIILIQAGYAFCDHKNKKHLTLRGIGEVLRAIFKRYLSNQK